MDHHRLSVAPMMDRTDRYFRYFLRLISRHVLLYTEMVTHDAVIFGDRSRVLGYAPEENPLVLQLGGSDPKRLGEAAVIAEEAGFAEVNLNVGCPSDRVQARLFGACLMNHPELVAECVAEMAARVKIPVTVKHRIGVDEKDSYEDMVRFVEIVSQAPCTLFTVHARKAWLKGLSPRENRNIPPLRYDDVYRLKREFPHLKIEINGGIKSLDETEAHLEKVDGVMIGRSFVEDPYMLAEADRRIFGDATAPVLTRREVAEAFIPFAARNAVGSTRLITVVRHTHGLFRGQVGARVWRRYLAENASKSTDAEALILGALEAVEAAQAYRDQQAREQEALRLNQGAPCWTGSGC